MPPKRKPQNPYIGKAERLILERLRECEEEELTRFQPGGWWIESDQVSANVCWSLVRKCLISRDTWEGTSEYYQINEEGRKCLNDPKYVPLMIRELRKLARKRDRAAARQSNRTSDKEKRIFCKYCGAKLKRDSVGLYCPTKNCQWQYGLPKEEDSPTKPPKRSVRR